MTDKKWKVKLKALKDFGGITDTEIAIFLAGSTEQDRQWLANTSPYMMAVNPAYINEDIMIRLKRNNKDKHGQGVSISAVQPTAG